MELYNFGCQAELKFPFQVVEGYGFSK
jgi:hypothetical protein